MEPEPHGAAFFCLEPESAPGARTSEAEAGATKKSGGSATLGVTDWYCTFFSMPKFKQFKYFFLSNRFLK